MRKKLLQNGGIGIAIALAITCLIQCIIEQRLNGELHMQNYMFTKITLSSIAIGLGFGLPAVIYDDDRLSLPFQTIIHFMIGITVLCISSYFAGWLPLKYGIYALVGSFILGVIIFFIIWTLFYLYNKKESKEMTKKLKEHQKK